MLTFIVQFVGGLVLLVAGAHVLVQGAVDAAKRLGVPGLVIGLTLVAWGTSAPELALNAISAWKGRGDLSLGNVIGANICNMSLVLGVAALIAPLMVQERMVRVELWLNAVLLCGVAGVSLWLGLGRVTAGVMLGAFLVYSVWTVLSALRDAKRAGPIGDSSRDPSITTDPAADGPMPWWKIITFMLGGLVLLSLGGSLASDGATGMALALGLAPAVVGVTIVSFGTTLPELVTGITAVRKGQVDLAVGNAIGSCLFNVGLILGLAALISPPGDNAKLWLPMLTMAGLSLVLVVMARLFDRRITRAEGALLAGAYLAFLVASGVTASA